MIHLIAVPNPALSGSHSTSIHDVSDELPTFSDLLETLTFQSGFNTNMVIAGTTLLGIAAGIIGVFALLRKRSLMTDALSHATLPGIALAFLIMSSLGYDGKSIPALLVGATITGVFGVVCIQAILRYSRLQEDTAIGIVLSVFFGAGIVGLSYIQANAPSGSGGLNHFIYGQAATMQTIDVLVMGAIALVSMIAAGMFFKEFTIICFNDAFAKVDGWPISIIDLVMMGLVVLVTVAGLPAVGLILVVSMLIIPPVAARFWTEKLWKLILISAIIGASSGYFGSVLSSLFPRKPAGAMIVLTAGLMFVLSFLFAPSRGLIGATFKRLKLQFLIAGDHVLELAFDREQTELSKQDLFELTEFKDRSKLVQPCILSYLKSKGMLKSYSTAQIVLSDRGYARGQRVSRNHTLWEQYLISYADIASGHVDWSVDQVEHVLSDDIIHELEIQLRDRGIEIPQAKGAIS